MFSLVNDDRGILESGRTGVGGRGSVEDVLWAERQGRSLDGQRGWACWIVVKNPLPEIPLFVR